VWVVSARSTFQYVPYLIGMLFSDFPFKKSVVECSLCKY